MIISLENWSHFTDLERAFYEKYSYESLLGYMAQNNISENRAIYMQEYIEVMKNYNVLCKLLEKEIISNAIDYKDYSWEVDFIERCVTIREKTS